MPRGTRQLLKYLSTLTGKESTSPSHLTKKDGEDTLTTLLRNNLCSYARLRQLEDNKERHVWEAENVPETPDSKQAQDLIMKTCKLCFVSSDGEVNSSAEEVSDEIDYAKRFLTEVIHILKELCDELDHQSSLQEELRMNAKSESSQRPLQPPNLLGVKDQGIISTAVDYLGVVGFEPNFLPGFGPCISPGALKSKRQSGEESLFQIDERRLLSCTMAFVHVCNNDTLGPLVQPRCVPYIISGLLQLGYSEGICAIEDQCMSLTKKIAVEQNSVSTAARTVPKFDCQRSKMLCIHERERCKKELVNLMQKLYQPLLIKVVMGLQKGKPFKNSSHNSEACKKTNVQETLMVIKKTCGRILSQLIMKDKGVLSLIQALLDGCDPDTLVWQKCDGIGKILAMCPQQAESVEDYYMHISGQLLGLLEMSNQRYGSQILRIVGSCISYMAQKHAELAKKYIFAVIMKPWLAIQHEGSESNTAGFEEGAVFKSIEDIFKIFILGTDPAEHLIRILQEVLDPLFQLYCFTKDSASVLQSLTKDLLLRYLRNSEIEHSIWVLQSCILGTRTRPGAEISVLLGKCNKIIRFEYGSSGGVKILGHVVESKDCGDTLGVDTNWMSTELRITCVLSLLRESKKEDLVSELFLTLLRHCIKRFVDMKGEELKGDFTTVDEEIHNLHTDISLVSLLSALGEEFGSSVLKDQAQIGSFVKLALAQYCHCLEQEADPSSHPFESSSTSLALGLLAVLLGQDEPLDFTFFEDTVPYLEKISNSEVDSHVRHIARQLRIGIMTRGAVWETASKEEGCKPFPLDLQSEAAYARAIEELKDPLLPTRGHALMQLSKMLDNRNPKALEAANELLKIFRENVVDEDTYIYLAAIQGLVSLADKKHSEVIPFLANEFAMFPNKDAGNKTSCKVNYSPEVRMKLGESLMKATRNLGELVPLYGQVLLASFLTGAKDPDEFIRSSSLSNVGETCKLMRFSLGSIVYEIFECVSSVALSDAAKQARRAATSVITQLLRGLGEDVLTVMESLLLDLYRLLKRIQENDPDNVTRAHAECALAQLENIMREHLFKKPELRKEIRVLP